ncbi:hypothetical protein AGIG_G20680 [Arapaima gigas]
MEVSHTKGNAARTKKPTYQLARSLLSLENWLALTRKDKFGSVKLSLVQQLTPAEGTRGQDGWMRLMGSPMSSYPWLSPRLPMEKIEGETSPYRILAEIRSLLPEDTEVNVSGVEVGVVTGFQYAGGRFGRLSPRSVKLWFEENKKGEGREKKRAHWAYLAGAISCTPRGWPPAARRCEICVGVISDLQL